MVQLTPEQALVIDGCENTKTFLSGPAGTGKSTAAVAVLDALLRTNHPGSSILVLVPQRTLALPFYDYLNQAMDYTGTQVTISTLGGLAQHAVDLFWPEVAATHGFKEPGLRPSFLSLETAQYFMARVVGQLIDQQGLFETVTIERNRIYSQIIDNLNKSAVVGFPYTEISARLKDAWSGDDTQRRMYDDVQVCANLFREYCLEHNLLDFSLQVEVFMRRLWPVAAIREKLFGGFRHIIAENIEEDTPATHDVLAGLLENADSGLVVFDIDAGYRRFLGADPDGAWTMQDYCDRHITFEQSFVTSSAMRAFGHHLATSLGVELVGNNDDPHPALRYDNYRFHPQMIDGVAEAIIDLVENQGVEPGEIVVLAPYLSDALRFSLMNRLDTAGVPVRSHRPSRALNEEPAARCLLTLAWLAHPQWGQAQMPVRGAQTMQYDVITMLMEAIDRIDLVRAQLLARGGFRIVDRIPRLERFDNVPVDLQARITFVIGERYDTLRAWIERYQRDEPLPLDYFLSALFGEVLSQPGFGFHDNLDAAGAAANLIDSARRFRQIIEQTGAPPEDKTISQEYAEMVGQGIIADQYLRSWNVEDDNSVLLAPAYTFLMSNRPVDYQFWVNVGGRGWSERLYQPLTNPYVLTRYWPQGMQWSDMHEVQVAQESLYRLTLGLTRRCRDVIYLGFSELGEQGYEQRGELVQAVQRMLLRTQNDDR